jgi:PKD repeat protein
MRKITSKYMLLARRIFYVFVLLLTYSNAFSQGEANNWYFGQGAAISFKTSPPTPLKDCPMSTKEGSASISDNFGNLLFCTDGAKVYNRNQKLMKNGTGLFGNSTSAQSAIIVRKPNSKTIYYIFTVSGFTGGARGYNYSTVDLSHDFGLGAVVSKNSPLIYSLSSKSESITAAYHSNNRDIWIICYDSDKQQFASFLVTPSGVNTTPVTTSHTNGGGFYCAKVSSNGLKYAVSSQVGILLADFNPSNGRLSNINSISSTMSYGIEFSPSSKLLYYTTTTQVFQFDISLSTLTGIINSKKQVGNGRYMYAMQLGPDKQIWIAVAGDTTLSVIQNPDKEDTACQFRHRFLGLLDNSPGLGLPTFFNSYFNPEYSFKGDCLGDTTWFTVNETTTVDSVLWNFGDTVSKNNTAKGLKVFHIFSSIGEFRVRAIAYRDQFVDTNYFFVNLNLYFGKLSNFPKEIYKCYDDTLTLSLVNPAGYKMQWSTGSDSSSTRVIDSGYVTLKKFYGSNCYSDDTVKIIFYKNNIVPGAFSLGNDIVKCYYDSIKLACPDNSAYKYKWSNGVSNKPIYVKQPATITLIAYFEGSCYKSDTITITEHKILNLNLGPDTFFCAKNTILIGDWDKGFVNYTWSTGATSPFIVPDTAGTYSLIVKDENWCSYYDTVKVKTLAAPKLNLGADLSFCDKAFHILDAKNISPFNTYKWGTGSSNQTDTATKSGKYWVRVSNRCGSSIDTINLKFLTKPVAFLPYNVILCDSVPVVLNAGNMDNDVSYYWSNGVKTQYNLVNDTGLYKLRLSNYCGIDSTSVLFTKCLNWVTIQTEGNCINKPVKFSIDETIQLDSLKWDFGDKTFSTKVKDVTHIYSKPGIYTVRLILFYNNRSDTVSTAIDIKNPKADFSVTDVCENESVKFINKTLDTSINNFRWKFGDGQSSLLNSPSHLYIIGGVSQTFNVTFVIQTKEGCSDSIIKAVTVNANPVSDFNFTLNQNKVDFEALQNGNTSYKWTFGNGDSAISNQKNYSYTYSKLNKNYTACLKTINPAGCFSKTCKEISVTVGISSISKNAGFNIYPNPNSGSFTIEIDNPVKEVSVEIYSQLGELVKKVEMVGKLTLIDLNVSQGIYLVMMKNGEEVWSQKILVTK